MPLESALVHGVRPNSSALQDLIKHHLPGRDPRLPDIYRYSILAGHPGRRVPSSLHNTYVVFVDSSEEGKKHALELAESFGTPMGRKETMLKNNPGAY